MKTKLTALLVAGALALTACGNAAGEPDANAAAQTSPSVDESSPAESTVR